MTTVAIIDTIAAVAVVRAQYSPSRKMTQIPGVTTRFVGIALEAGRALAQGLR